jgi:colicin import membrane protein
MMLFALAIAGIIYLFKKLGGDVQVLKDTFSYAVLGIKQFFQNLALLYYKLMDKITPGDKYKKLAEEQELKIQKTKDERAEIAKGISDRMKNNRAANAHDAKNLDEKKKLDAEKNKIDYASGPEALLKQFSAKEGGLVEMGVKKDEAGKDKAAAEKQLEEAKTTAEKKAAIAKIEEAEKKIAALDKAQALAKERSTAAAPAAPDLPKDKQEAAKKAEGTKKEIEAKGEEKNKADEKAKADAAAKEEADKKSKEGGDKSKTPAGQESAETLLAQLNSSMARLIQLTAQTTTNTYEQVKATKSLSNDLFSNV